MLKVVGLALFCVGFASTMIAMAFVRPGVSRAAVFMRGSFQRRGDYSDAGWRLSLFGRLAGVIGFALVVAAIYFLGV